MEFPCNWTITWFTDDGIRNMEREMYWRWGRKQPGIRVIKGQEAGKIKGNQTAIFNILQYKNC